MNQQKILFITPNSIGDAVLATGLLAHLVETYPDAAITIATGPAPADLFRAVPRLDQRIVMRKQSWKRHWLKFWMATVATRWNLVVDLRNSLFSRLLFAARRAYRPKASGQHKVIDNAATLQLTPPPSPKIWVDQTAENNAARLFAAVGDKPVLAFGPAANWYPKQWPIEHFIDLAKRLTANDGLLPDAFIFIAAAPHERAMIEPLLKTIPAMRLIDACGQDLLTVAACLKRCRLFVGNDSGLMHLSAAMGTKTLGLFGPGYEDIYRPWGPNGRFVRTPEKREILLARLTNPNQPNLMETLTVDTVLTAVRDFLM